jgi:hypothetical protein
MTIRNPSLPDLIRHASLRRERELAQRNHQTVEVSGDD